MWRPNGSRRPRSVRGARAYLSALKARTISGAERAGRPATRNRRARAHDRGSRRRGHRCAPRASPPPLPGCAHSRSSQATRCGPPRAASAASASSSERTRSVSTDSIAPRTRLSLIRASKTMPVSPIPPSVASNSPSLVPGRSSTQLAIGLQQRDRLDVRCRTSRRCRGSCRECRSRSRRRRSRAECPARPAPSSRAGTTSRRSSPIVAPACAMTVPRSRVELDSLQPCRLDHETARRSALRRRSCDPSLEEAPARWPADSSAARSSSTPSGRTIVTLARRPPPQPVTTECADSIARECEHRRAASTGRMDFQREQRKPRQPGELQRPVGQQHVLGRLPRSTMHELAVAEQAGGERARSSAVATEFPHSRQ